MITDNENLVCFGQIVVGPPGSGKTTYCNGMSQYLKALGRDVAIINLDPANHGERVPYEADIDIEELVCLQGVMDSLNLGPNGGIIYCLEYLETNIDWLLDKLKALRKKYILFDFPGQVELFTHYTCIQTIVQKLISENFRLAAVHLVDAYHCSDASRFISVVLVSLMSMLRLELPHLNVLSKVDLIESYGPLAFNLDFFTECTNIEKILMYIDSPAMVDYDFANDHQYVEIEQDSESVGRVLAKIDKANGYVVQFLSSDDVSSQSLQSINVLFRSVFSGNEADYEHISSVQEKYMSGYHE